MRAFSITDIGKRRKLNQDYVFTSETEVGPLPNLFLVADGMGGHNAGDYASRCTIETIVKEVSESNEQSPVFVLESAIKQANAVVRKKSTEEVELFGMGTTIVGATITGDMLRVANVGDSRLYIINNREIKQITKDHSLVEEMIRMGGLNREDAKKHPDKNIITRAIGAQNNVDVDFFELTLEKDDVVLMCTDGLTNMVDDEEIRMIIMGQKELVEKGESLIKAANNNGGKDNIGVVIIEPFAS